MRKVGRYDIAIKRVHVPIYGGQARAALVLRVAQVLRRYTQSAFQFEAWCRHELRQALCLRGYDWDRSDREAAAIVRDALSSIGAKRPSYEEGQRTYTVSTDYCLHCSGPMDDAKGRFCSTDCAKTFMVTHHYDVVTGDGGAIRQAAYRMVKHGDTERHCQHCNEPFRALHETAKFCSVKCGRAAQIEALPARDCAVCNSPFHPNSLNDKLCSDDCRNAQQRQRRVRKPKAHAPLTAESFDKNWFTPDALPAMACAWCSTIFVPLHTSSKFCGVNCKSREYQMRTERKVPRAIRPAVFDHYFTVPINASLPAWLTPERFDELIAA